MPRVSYVQPHSPRQELGSCNRTIAKFSLSASIPKSQTLAASHSQPSPACGCDCGGPAPGCACNWDLGGFRVSCVSPGTVYCSASGLAAAYLWLGIWPARAPIHCPVVFLTPSPVLFVCSLLLVSCPMTPCLSSVSRAFNTVLLSPPPVLGLHYLKRDPFLCPRAMSPS